MLTNRIRLPLAAFIENQVRNSPAFEGDEEQAREITQDLLAFIRERLKIYLREEGHRHDLLDAVFAAGEQDDLLLILLRLQALEKFLDTEDGANLLAGVKRALNILKIEEKKDRRTYKWPPLNQLLIAVEEKALHSAISRVRAKVEKAIRAEDYETALKALAQLRAPVDAFFEKVTVNAEDPTLRENRLKLLAGIRGVVRLIADFSKIEG